MSCSVSLKVVFEIFVNIPPWGNERSFPCASVLTRLVQSHAYAAALWPFKTHSLLHVDTSAPTSSLHAGGGFPATLSPLLEFCLPHNNTDASPPVSVQLDTLHSFFPDIKAPPLLSFSREGFLFLSAFWGSSFPREPAYPPFLRNSDCISRVVLHFYPRTFLP